MIRGLVLVSAFSLPFTKALTLNLMFPIKIYEVALLVAGMLVVSRLRVPVPATALWEVRLLAVFIGVAFLLLMLRLIVPAEGLSDGWLAIRFGSVGDGLAKLLYLVFAAFGFILFSVYTARDEGVVVRAWLAGAVLASLYAWYLFFASLIENEPILLPGIESPQRIQFRSGSFIRSGTFEEGNFMGLYLIVSTALAVYTRRFITGAFLALSGIITFSTATLIGLAVFWALYLRHRLARQDLRLRTLGSVVVGLLVLATLAVSKDTPFVQEVVVDKVLGEGLGSRQDRTDQIVTGLRMFGDHPLLGVGLARYGYHYYHYQSSDVFGQFYGRTMIPNNVYVELFSELGIIGTGVFVAFLVSIYRRARTYGLEALKYGLWTTLVVFMAYPSYLVMFLWAFFAVIVGASIRRTRGEARVWLPKPAGLT